MNQPAPELGECPACGAKNLPDARFCSQCAAPLQSASLDTKHISSEQPLSAPDAVNAGDHLADPLIGVVIAGRYRIVEPLGRGGMGVVYKVEHARIGKLMALKLLTGELGRDQELVGRFKREALMVSKLSHPNTVQVFDYGTSEGLTYLAMEYLRGDDLGRIIRKGGPLTPERMIKIVVQICSSLAEAHDLDIVHRDLKPENIIVLKGPSGSDLVKVLDFGLAKLRESAELGEVTSRGAIVGTPFYMSPEQIRGEAADQRSDIYALGALIFTCLTGRPPFDAPRPMGVLTKHLTEEPPSPSERFPELGISTNLSAIVLRALAKDPVDRFQHVRELQEALVDELQGQGAGSIDLLLDSGQMRRLAEAGSDLVTRDEVAAYEKKLRRRGQFAWGALIVGLAAGGLVGLELMTGVTGERPFAGVEREPNNGAADANALPFEEQVIGQIGQRLSAESSDRDFYRVRIPEGTPAIRLKLTALPNMALCSYIYRTGIEQPLGRFCPGQPGRDLVIDALELEPAGYLFAVLQDRDRYGENPPPPVHENVSDAYRLSVGPAELDPGRELEPNDDLKSAQQVRPGSEIRGRVAWMRDVDTFCVAESGPVRFVVDDASRPDHAVLEATPAGGPADGIPVRIHRRGSRVTPSPRDVVAPWTSPVVDSSKASACLRLALVANPWAPTPHPHVPPASDDEYVVRIEKEASE
jgi:eukaryotic-like serine/threonine-protein kinase